MKLLSFLFPSKCILCRRVLRSGEVDLCRSCRMDQPVWRRGKRKPQFLDSITAVWYYEGYSRRSILRFKFYHGRYLAPGFGRLLSMELIQQFPQGFDLITWVPISFLRRAERGYDQGQLLAKAVGRELHQPPVRLLWKIRHNRRQSSISGIAPRRANVLNAYRVTDPQLIRDKRILLLDDVLTTGATASECARVLLTAGAREVHCAAITASRKL